MKLVGEIVVARDVDVQADLHNCTVMYEEVNQKSVHTRILGRL